MNKLALICFALAAASATVAAEVSASLETTVTNLETALASSETTLTNLETTVTNTLVTPPVSRASHAIVRLLNSRAAGSPRGYEEAARTVLADAEAGKTLQRYLVAVLAADRDAPECLKLGAKKRARYLEETREKILALAEEHNSALAWYLLSLETNDLKYLERAADGGNVQALNAWGTRLVNDAFESNADTNGMQSAMSRGFRYFKRASDQGDENGLYNTGMCYMNGYGVEPNLNLAFACFKTAAEKGHPEAINNIGGFYRDGVVVRRNPETAVEFFRKSAECGNSYGQLNYAIALQDGTGVARDEQAAARLLELSARQGNPEAMCRYGMCFRNGSGVEKNLATAFRWFELSARYGFATAMLNLSECYERGEGVRADPERSQYWFVRARAAQGDRNAAAWLAQQGYDE